VLSLAKMGKIRARAKKIGFGDMNTSFKELAAGKIEGRAVLIPR
jgi:D-arabinose 1-dehydrogenase-like Zn-dependent alcohol dehydrogenase